MSKFVDSVGHRTGVIGLPDASGSSYQADVNALGQVQIAIAAAPGGVLNATGQVSLGTSATQIIAANSRQGVLITNPSTTVTVYIGGAGVTIANGQALAPGCSLSLPVVSAVFGVVATSTQTVSYVEVI